MKKPGHQKNQVILKPFGFVQGELRGDSTQGSWGLNTMNGGFLVVHDSVVDPRLSNPGSEVLG